MRDIYSPNGDREQASVNDGFNATEFSGTSYTLRFGVISEVFTADNPKNVPGNGNGRQGYLVYTVKLSPNGVVVKNVPAMSTGGHYSTGNRDTPNAGPLDEQNTDETPYVIGQPVIIGFVNGSNFNPIILGPGSCQHNAGSQTMAQYPQKSEVFQGHSRIVDKDGSEAIILPVTGLYTIKVGTITLLTIENGLVQIGNGTEAGVLGNSLRTYLENHTHAAGTFSNSGGPVVGFSGAPNSPVDASSVVSSLFKVQ